MIGVDVEGRPASGATGHLRTLYFESVELRFEPQHAIVEHDFARTDRFDLVI